MPTYGFGAGALWGTPLTDAAGNTIANPTPILFGVLQEVSVDLSFDVKELHGQNSFPVDVARGKGKIGGKAKFARFNGLMLNSLFFGQTVSSSIVSDVYDTTGAAIPATPFQITPTIPSSGTWSRDLGVRNASGNPMVRVASAPVTGQYSVAAGVYTFAAADTGLTVFIDFQYTATSTTAKKIVAQNVVMGAAPTFRADLLNTHSGSFIGLSLFSCVSTKLSMATKLDDYLIPEFDFSGFADASGNVLNMGLSE
jgi:hypothetical protein